MPYPENLKFEHKKFVPFVIDKTLKRKEFDPNLIYKSLRKETNISEENAKKITKDITRKIIGISSLIPYLTSPMIREVTNTTLLQYGLTEERLQYTRIGFPRYDLKKIFENNNKPETDIKIVKHIRNEFYNVEELIKAIKKQKLEEKPKLMNSLEYLEKKKIKKVESKKILEYL